MNTKLAIAFCCLLSVATAKWVGLSMHMEAECKDTPLLRGGIRAGECVDLRDFEGEDEMEPIPDVMKRNFAQNMKKRFEGDFFRFDCGSKLTITIFDDPDCLSVADGPVEIEYGTCMDLDDMHTQFQCFDNIAQMEKAFRPPKGLVSLFVENYEASNCVGEPSMHLTMTSPGCVKDDETQSYVKLECTKDHFSTLICEDDKCKQCTEVEEEKIPLKTCINHDGGSGIARCSSANGIVASFVLVLSAVMAMLFF